MKTLLTDSPDVAAEFIRRGDATAFPTETVYGLGANAFDERAVAKIFEAKGRPSDNPLIVHVSREAEIPSLVREVSPVAQQLIERFFPGPLTVVLPKSLLIPDVVTAGLSTVAIRMPRHPVARLFLDACGVPVAAPSANLSGRPSPTSWQAALSDLDGRVPCILKGDRSEVGLESTVVDCTREVPALLRPGAVSLEELRHVVHGMTVADVDTPGPPPSPGIRHRHYSPRARVVIVDHPREIPELDVERAAYIGLTPPLQPLKLVNVCRDVEHYAHELYDFFYRCDVLGVETIFSQQVPEHGLGRGLIDRLRRASEKFS